ncbi:MAG TPA: 2-oxoglutarate dehydrogenase complex dihydrolipoyllysine-residue succinyltransferase [Methylocella sp.]|nr:2-oxoglutarate dehydrogenase complex dihydrolipoyllysine-residue succinyltransferase [Methylocella sp.]
MRVEIRVPSLGESVTEATIGRWFKKAGEAVKVDEPIVELETDKVTLEVNAPAAGTLTEILAKDGATVAPGALLGQIGDGSGAGVAQPLAAEMKPPASPAPPPSPAPAPIAAPEAAPPEAGPAMPPSPAAAKIAADHDLDPAALDGSGKRGQLLKGDVLEALAKMPAPAPQPAVPFVPQPAPPPAARSPQPAMGQDHEERMPMSRLRQTIARRLKEAQNAAAMLTTFNEADMSAIIDLRARYKDPFEKKHGVRLGFMGFFVKACVGALKTVPSVNAEIDGTDIIYKDYYHLGVAVGTDKGLVVPVVRQCDQLSLAGIEKSIADLGKRARAGTLKIEELQGGTFTITNGGIYGSLMSTPILNVPQSGILGMHKIQERPVAIGGKVEIRPMMYLALTYDHRLVDGKEAVTFLVAVKEALEDPARLVLDI